MYKNIIIVGTGWYGCYIAEFIIDNYPNINIILIDQNKNIFQESSYKNQNRLHLGFHYPRCDITLKKCKKYYYKFIEKYNFLTNIIDKNYYIISNKSNIDYNTYINKYKEQNIHFQTIKNNFIKNIDGNILNTQERFVDFEKTKEYFKEKFKNKVKFIMNYHVDNIAKVGNKILINNDLECDALFNCTYNQIQSHKNVIYEKCLTLLYKKIGDTPFDCLTIMDGKFSSLYNYKNNIYTLTNVEHTPLIKGDWDIVKNYSNYSLNKKIKLFEKNIIEYYSIFKEKFEYYGYYESYKCKNISKNDSRDINILVSDKIFNVWCGKISLIFELDDHIKNFIEKL